MTRRQSPNVLFALLGLALMHVLHLVLGSAFFVVPGIAVAVALAALGAYSDPLSCTGALSSVTRRRVWLAAAFTAVLLGPEVVEELVLGGPVPRTEST